MKERLMNALQKVKNILNKVIFLLPSRLPSGMKEFESWASSIIQTYNFPDNDSTRFALATMILHLESVAKIELNLLIVKILIPTSAFKSKQYFAQTVLKSMSNQVAAGVMQDLKEKQKREAEEAAAKEAQEKQQ